MDKSLTNLIDTCINVGVAHDHLIRLSEICYECKDILCEILGDEKFESFRQMIKSIDESLELNIQKWVKDNFNICNNNYG